MEPKRKRQIVVGMGVFTVSGLVISAYTIQLEAAMLTGVAAYVVFCLMYQKPDRKGE